MRASRRMKPLNWKMPRANHSGAKTQHPRQMLRILRSSSLSRSLTVALSSRSRTVSLAARRDFTVANRVRLILAARCTGNVRNAVGGDTVDGIAGLMAGGGIAGTLAALPMPLGSLTEPLRPRAFATQPWENETHCQPAPVY